MEIKFRAWDTERKEMLPVKLMDWTEWWVSCDPTYGKAKPLEYGERNSFKNERTDRHILMQYTGLRDSNGVEVYDGDIYRNLDSGLIGKLTIVDGVGGIYVLCTEYKDGRIYNNMPFMELDTTNFEVIGNVYENPDLLQGEMRHVD